MRRHKSSRHRAGGALQPVDPLFAEELTGRRAGGRDRRSNSRNLHKTLQLCRQAQRALSLALAGACDDDVLRSLYVAAVVPAPDASRLLVQLVVPTRVQASPAEVLRRIERVRSLLRAEVAAAITRKRAPELTFFPGGEGQVSP